MEFLTFEVIYKGKSYGDATWCPLCQKGFNGSAKHCPHCGFAGDTKLTPASHFYYISFTDPGAEYPTLKTFDDIDDAEIFAYTRKDIKLISEYGGDEEEWYKCSACQTFVNWREIDDEICDDCAEEFDRIDRLCKKGY